MDGYTQKKGKQTTKCRFLKNLKRNKDNQKYFSKFEKENR